MQKTTTFLMFVGDKCGKAEDAMRFYTSLFKNSGIQHIERYGPEDRPDKEGTVKHGRFTLSGLEYMAMDSARAHPFSFTPSFSLFVACESEEEIDALYARLVDGGSAMMPLGYYGFSRKFAWVGDRYGVSWQLNLP